MKRDIIFIIALICMQGYIMVPAFWESAPAPAHTLSSSSSATIPTPYAPAPVPTAQPPLVYKPTPTAIPSPPAAPKAERVLIVSFDGMRPDAISAAPMTNLLKLIKTGAYTLNARTISYPTTLPSHTAMLSGMCMEKNGMRWNGNNLYRGYSRGDDIFDLTAGASMFSAMIVGKDKLRQIAQPETTSDFEVYWDEDMIAQAAIKVVASDFDLLFVHFPSADTRGHKYGWMSNAQFKALREGDAALADILAALDKNGMRKTTLVIVTADHGGHDKTHDGMRIEDYRIPWIASGPGIVPGKLNYPIKTMDTAATAAYALGLPFQPEWDGIPIYEAFGEPQQDVHFDKGCK